MFVIQIVAYAAVIALAIWSAWPLWTRPTILVWRYALALFSVGLVILLPGWFATTGMAVFWAFVWMFVMVVIAAGFIVEIANYIGNRRKTPIDNWEDSE